MIKIQLLLEKKNWSTLQGFRIDNYKYIILELTVANAIYAYTFDEAIQENIIAGYKLCPESEESNIIIVFFTIGNDNNFISEKEFID